jgi:SpoVK/Ycf46/Vps4 family AAA+-type ATPase
MDERLDAFVDLGIALAELSGQARYRDRGAWDQYIERFRQATAEPLPRTHRRLRVPADVAASMLRTVGSGPHPYDRFLLPPSVRALTAGQLDDPAILGQATEVVDAWRDLVADIAGLAAAADVQITLEPERWPTEVDRGDFPPSVNGVSAAWDGWDASTRAALASLPDQIPAETRTALLLGLWSGAGRSPRLPTEWEQARSWISSEPIAVRDEADLASARVWAMSAVSPLYQAENRAAMDTFMGWAYRRAGTWPTFTSIDPEIHQRLREQWPTQSAGDGGLWPEWVQSAVVANKMTSPVATVSRVRKTASVDDLLGDLDALIGLEPVKTEIRQIVNLVRLEQAKASQGLPTAPIDLHMVLTGNPGTGKTTVARLYGQILRALGALRTGVFLEVTRADLAGTGHAGASERTQQAMDAADGGVLFIDEAYSLTTGHQYDDGPKIINELVAGMESRRGSIAVVVAGYPGLMTKFMEANPGLKSRFRNPVLFPDMSNTALLAALQLLAGKEGYRIDEAALAPLRLWIAAMPRGEGFGNVREMRKLLGILKQGVAGRYAAAPETVAVEVIVSADVPTVGPGRFDPVAYVEAMARLNELVGLQPVRDVVAGVVDQARLAQMLRDRGKHTAPIDIGHMVFTGNPGTGKTTAAARLGAIFAAAGLLRNGHVHTVGRADLVGEYLGQTGPKVRAAVSQALDGVLFIDEAYSLTAESHWDMYAREAVTTLVDEIERHRDRLVVIMAGYPDEMEEFLASNEGLQSRVRHTIEFPDFDRSQLRQIAIDMVAERHKRITEEAADAITGQAMALAGSPGFANARTVRNLVDNAIGRHAARVVNASGSEQQTAALVTIERCDVADIDTDADQAFGFLA